MKTAIVTGVTGQDGSYLAEFLLHKGYRAVGMHRRSSTDNLWRLETALKHPEFILEGGDVSDATSINRLMQKYDPDEWYNLAAMSHVHESWDQAAVTTDINYIGVLHTLNAAVGRKVRIYQASTSEMFGDCAGPQNEDTPFHPNSPYAIAKTAAHFACMAYRMGKGVWVSCGILFNHESSRRGDNFVTQKIAKGIRKIKGGEADKLILGNTSAKRDWGWAPEYTIGMWKILQMPKPSDYVLATGETHTILEFVKACEKAINLKEIAKIEVSADCLRPQEVPLLCGNATKAAKEFGWRPTVKYQQLARNMVDMNGKLDFVDWEKVEQGCLGEDHAIFLKAPAEVLGSSDGQGKVLQEKI